MKCKVCDNEEINMYDRFCKICGTKLLSERTITLNFKQLTIIKHALQNYIVRAKAKDRDRMEEVEVLEEIIKVLDTMY